MLVASNRASIDQAGSLIQEANELISILVTSRKTVEQRKKRQDLDDKQLRGSSHRCER